MSRFTRKKLFVDPKIQGALLLRVICYWLSCLVTTLTLAIFYRLLTAPAKGFFLDVDAIWNSFGFVIIASLLVLPIVVYDLLQTTNRFAGPLLRLRESLRAMARGEQIRPLRFREGDFWPEVAEEFNAVLLRLQQFEIARGATTKPKACELDSKETLVATSEIKD